MSIILYNSVPNIPELCFNDLYILPVNFITDRPCDKLAVVTALVKGNSVSATI
jgi:hypothetical protein